MRPPVAALQSPAEDKAPARSSAWDRSGSCSRSSTLIRCPTPDGYTDQSLQQPVPTAVLRLLKSAQVRPFDRMRGSQARVGVPATPCEHLSNQHAGLKLPLTS